MIPPEKIVVPSKHETFEAQVLVVTESRVEHVSPYNPQASQLFVPFEETTRILQSGNYRVVLVPSHTAGGKPALILYEMKSADQSKWYG